MKRASSISPFAAALLLSACSHVGAPAASATAAIGTHAVGSSPGVPGCASSAVAAEVLQRVNAVRARGQQCGRKSMAPAGPLKWDEVLHSAASQHSVDMARRNYFDHVSPEGVSVSQRVPKSVYKWRNVGENLAGGDESVAEVVQGWLDSPAHCENMMDARYADMALACAAKPGTQWGTYWTMVLARR
jgi:uncharacterized protein YkwD